jgi:peroxiredoxin family protein
MKKLAFIVGSDSFEKMMMPFIIAQTADAMDVEVYIFYTFWGLKLLKNGYLNKAKVEGMPFPMKGLAASMFKKKLKKLGTPGPVEIVKELMEDGNVHLYACNMTMELMGIKKEDLIPEVEKVVGAAAFLEMADDADQVLVFA